MQAYSKSVIFQFASCWGATRLSFTQYVPFCNIDFYFKIYYTARVFLKFFYSHPNVRFYFTVLLAATESMQIDAVVLTACYRPPFIQDQR